MSSEYDYQMWIYRCQKIIRQAQINRLRRNRILLTLILNDIAIQKKKNKYKKKRFWVHPFYKLRREHGFFEAVFPTLSSFPEKFENYIRMSASQFEELLCLIGPDITKKNVVREPISATARLVMTLR